MSVGVEACVLSAQSNPIRIRRSNSIISHREGTHNETPITVGFLCLGHDRASALRTTAVHLAGGSRLYKTRSLLFVHLTCL